LTFVYALVSDQNDIYLEQTVISIKSLRIWNPEDRIIVLVDQDTYKTIKGKRDVFQQYKAEVCKVVVPEDMTKKDKSRYLKTTMRENVKGAFLYIDGDTLICQHLDVQFESAIGCVKDKHYSFSNHPSKNRIADRASKCGYHTDFQDCHYNGGLMWVSDKQETYEFFDLWHKLWKEGLTHGVTQDQASLNEANIKMNGIIAEIDGTWNCQLSKRTHAMPYICNAKIIHYFGSYGNKGVPFDLANKQVIQSILEENHAVLNKIVENPKMSFEVVDMLISDPDEADIIESRSFKHILSLYRKHRTAFVIKEKILHILDAAYSRIHS